MAGDGLEVGYVEKLSMWRNWGNPYKILQHNSARFQGLISGLSGLITPAAWSPGYGGECVAGVRRAGVQGTGVSVWPA